MNKLIRKMACFYMFGVLLLSLSQAPTLAQQAATVRIPMHNSVTMPKVPKKEAGTTALGAGAIQLPLRKPLVDQLGQMEGISPASQTILAVVILLQAIALIVIVTTLIEYAYSSKQKAS